MVDFMGTSSRALYFNEGAMTTIDDFPWFRYPNGGFFCFFFCVVFSSAWGPWVLATSTTGCPSRGTWRLVRVLILLHTIFVIHLVPQGIRSLHWWLRSIGAVIHQVSFTGHSELGRSSTWCPSRGTRSLTSTHTATYHACHSPGAARRPELTGLVAHMGTLRPKEPGGGGGGGASFSVNSC